jgi:hypothetical protein
MLGHFRTVKRKGESLGGPTYSDKRQEGRRGYIGGNGAHTEVYYEQNRAVCTATMRMRGVVWDRMKVKSK